MKSPVFPATKLQDAPADPGGFKHIPALDGVRGLAIFLVLVVHLFNSNTNPSNKISSFLLSLRISGWVGVDLFFVLSGFLITGILYDTIGTRRSMINFYGRRSLRIFPLYYLALAVVGILGVIGGHLWHGTQWYWLLYLQDTPLTFPERIPVWQEDHLNHLWSLAVEEQFYIIWPWIILLIKDRRKLIWIALFLAGVALVLRVILVHEGFTGLYEYKLLPCRMDSLLMGGALALALRGQERFWVKRLQWPVLIVTALALLMVYVANAGLDWQNSRLISSVGYSLLALFFAAFLALTLSSRPLQTLLSAASLRWLGRYSYGIYIWHMILPPYLAEPVRAAVRLHTHSRSLALLCSGILAIVLSLLCGFLSYHLYEVHFLRLKRYFSYTRAA